MDDVHMGGFLEAFLEFREISNDLVNMHGRAVGAI